MAYIDVYVAYPDTRSAKKAADNLLKKRLIACANFLPVESAYWWKGKVEKGRETLVIMKTRKNLWTKLKAEVRRIHPYEVPMIVRIEARANGEYEKWVDEETRQDGR